MKTTMQALCVGLALSLAATGALADRKRDGFKDTAKVLKATPLFETVQVNRPEQQCWTERVKHVKRGHRRDYAPTIAGAVLGGVVGNQLGHGRNRDALTVAGAVLGATVGHQYSGWGSDRRRGKRVYFTEEQHCETVDNYVEEEVLVGYRVKYRYRGRVFTTRTDEHPGRRIRVKVGVKPVERIAYNYVSPYQGDNR